MKKSLGKPSKTSISKKTFPVSNSFTGRVTFVTEEVLNAIVTLRRLYIEKDLGCAKYFETKKDEDIICTEEDIAEFHRLSRFVREKDVVAYYEQVD